MTAPGVWTATEAGGCAAAVIVAAIMNSRAATPTGLTGFGRPSMTDGQHSPRATRVVQRIDPTSGHQSCRRAVWMIRPAGGRLYVNDDHDLAAVSGQSPGDRVDCCVRLRGRGSPGTILGSVGRLPAGVGGPAYVFLAMRHGEDFVAASALSSFAANAVTGLFLIVYGVLAGRLPPWRCLGVAVLVWLAGAGDGVGRVIPATAAALEPHGLRDWLSAAGRLAAPRPECRLSRGGGGSSFRCARSRSRRLSRLSSPSVPFWDPTRPESRRCFRLP